MEKAMAIRNDHDDYGWAVPQNRQGGRDKAKRLHDYDEPVPVFKDTVLELAMTLGGIVGVFLLLIALVKVFA
jgi:hypothetical protein